MSILRATAHGYGAIDELSDVLGDVCYLERYAPRELTDTILGRHERRLLKVSRYYLLRDPKTIVDFEPAPPDKMYCDAKRQFFHVRKIVYVPIFRQEHLHAEQFAERLAQETAAMQTGAVNAADDASLRTVDDLLRDPAVVAFINAETLERIEAEGRAGRRLHGVARTARLAAIKQIVIGELKQKGADGLGREFGYRQLAVASR